VPCTGRNFHLYKVKKTRPVKRKSDHLLIYTVQYKIIKKRPLEEEDDRLNCLKGLFKRRLARLSETDLFCSEEK
jgi:hypothetical protein